ncbi:MAG: DUF1707 domain-containing protein [Propionibacterium sp.]|nr:DUF1707 domain-containing protein [Propionibacterium sp.]
MELPPSSKYIARRDEPVSDAERDSLTKRLADEFEQGRMTHDDYSRALDTLYDATTLGELVPVVEAVPDAGASVPAIVGESTGRPGELAPIRSGALPPVALGGAILGAVLVLLLLLAILI